MSPPPASTARLSASGDRLIGIDLARLVAIVGMMCAHVLAASTDGHVTARSWADGNASTLFAVLGGVSLVLATEGFRARGDARGARRAVAGRGAAIVAIGLTLGLVPTPAIVVLVYFGVAMWCAIPFLTAPSWVLATSAAVVAAGSGVLAAAARPSVPDDQLLTAISWTDLAHPVVAVYSVLVVGTYPVCTWFVYVVVGMLVGRAFLRARRENLLARVTVRIGVVGVLLAGIAIAAADVLYSVYGRNALLARHPEFAGPLPGGLSLDDVLREGGYGAAEFSLPSLLLDSPHTGTVLDIARGVGVALVVISACSGAALVVRGVGLSVIEPLRVAGSAPLTVYTAHVLLLAVARDIAASPSVPDDVWFVGGPGALALNVALALAIGGMLRVARLRGPLEAATSDLSSWAARVGRRVPA